MSEALHSFIISVSCIVGVAVLIPCVESIVRRLRRTPATMEPRETVQLTPAPSFKRRGI